MEKLSVGEKTGYGIGEIASNIIWQTIMFFLAIFYTDTFGIPAATVGTMFLVVRIFDAINDPIMGTIADRTNTRWGKYRPYILWMAVPYGLGGIFMFMTPNLGLSGKIIYAYGTYIAMMIIYTAIMIPFSALSGVMTSDSLERTSLNSYRFVGAFIGGLFIQGLALYMVAHFGVDNESVIQARLEQNGLEIKEMGAGTAKVTVTAEDPAGETARQQFLMKVNLPGENAPEVQKTLPDTLVEEGFGTMTLDISGLFTDKDQDPLEYSAKSSLNYVAEPGVKEEQLIIREQGVGTAIITLTADDGHGGVANQDFMVRVNSAGNRQPNYLGGLEDQVLQLNPEKQEFKLKHIFGIHEEYEFDISDSFKDPDGDQLYFTALSSDPSVVSAAIENGNLVVKKKNPGLATVTLRADDSKGGITTRDVLFAVKTTGNIPPAVTKPISDRFLEAGFGQTRLDLSDHFTDRDGDALELSFRVNNDAKGYRITMSIFAVMCIFLFLITFFSTRERVKPVSDKQSTLKEDFGDLIRNKPWLLLFFISLVTLIYVGLRSAVIAYYFQYFVGDSGLTAAFLVSGSVTIIIALAMTKWLTKIFGKRLLYVICMLVVGGSIIFYYFAKPTQILLIFALQIIQSFASGPTMPLLWSMLADAADYNEWKTGRKAMGLAYSASTMAQKWGIAFGGAIALWLLAYYGYQPNVQQSYQSLLGMRLMMSIYPALGAFLCAGLIWFYSLDGKKMEMIEQELKLKRSQNTKK